MARFATVADRDAIQTEMPYGERYIWGITAGIVRTIYERFYT